MFSGYLLRILYTVLVFQTVFPAYINSDGTEPNCYSRFDYEYKVVQKLSDLERRQTVLEGLIAELSQQTHTDKLTNALADQNPLANATATQSSTSWTRVASNAIDGDTNGEMDEGSCSHTESGNNVWWMVDFKRTFPVREVVIWNRRDNGFFSRLKGLKISVSMSEETIDRPENVCTTYVGPPCNGDPITLHCERNLIGQYLKIRQANGILQLCEVYVKP